MAGWSREHSLNRSAKAVVATMLLALALVAAVPVAFLVGLFLMLFGHAVAGLALFGGSILVAAAGVALAVLSGVRQVRHVRDLIVGRDPRDPRDLRDPEDPGDPRGLRDPRDLRAPRGRDSRVLKLGHDDYSYLG